jgi:hypothetical protein
MYKYNEDVIIKEIDSYVKSAYSKHYASEENSILAIEGIEAAGHGIGFCVGNIIKYAWRLGKKNGYNQDDVMKIIHYSILLLDMIRRKNDK